MNNNTKLEIAVEVLAAKIAISSSKGYNVEDEQMQLLIKQRQQMYEGNKSVIDKIIKEYGPEVEAEYNKV